MPFFSHRWSYQHRVLKLLYLGWRRIWGQLDALIPNPSRAQIQRLGKGANETPNFWPNLPQIFLGPKHPIFCPGLRAQNFDFLYLSSIDCVLHAFMCLKWKRLCVELPVWLWTAASNKASHKAAKPPNGKIRQRAARQFTDNFCHYGRLCDLEI